jgi:hypothetical protein
MPQDRLEGGVGYRDDVHAIKNRVLRSISPDSRAQPTLQRLQYQLQGACQWLLAEGWFVDRKIVGERNSSVDGIDIIQKASPLMV